MSLVTPALPAAPLAIRGDNDPKADTPLFPGSLFAINPIDKMDVEHTEIGGAPALIIDNDHCNEGGRPLRIWPSGRQPACQVIVVARFDKHLDALSRF